MNGKKHSSSLSLRVLVLVLCVLLLMGCGGSGGNAIIVYETKTWSGSYTLTGGAKGLKGGEGTSTDGVAGADGNYYEVKVSQLI